MDKHNSEWMTGVPWYNASIYNKVYGKMFEGFIRNERTDRYIIMCSIDVHERENQSFCNDGISGGGCPLPSNSTTEAFDLIGTIIYFIGCWLKALEHNFTERCNMYVFNMKQLLQKTPVKLSKQPSPKKNTNHYYMLLVNE